MKQIYIVESTNYTPKPLMAFENRNDAVKVACAIHECTASEAADYIKSMPFMCNPPQTVDPTDLQTVIDMAINATITANDAVSAKMAEMFLDMAEIGKDGAK